MLISHIRQQVLLLATAATAKTRGLNCGSMQPGAALGTLRRSLLSQWP